MNARNIKEIIKSAGNIGLILIFLGLICSCTDWDEFKIYSKNGEIIYSGKIDSVDILSGKERVKFTGQLNADPKISHYRIFWNNLMDSVEYSIEKSSGTLKIEQTFEVDEGVKNFTCITYDIDGNSSVPVNSVGTSYGNNYRKKLNNRLISSYDFTEEDIIINWELMDLTTGVQYTEIIYEQDGESKTLITPIDENQSILTGVNTSIDIQFRTIFKPETSSIDTFAVPYTQKRIIVYPKLKNAKIPFAHAERGGRWGNLAGWTTNDALKNHNGYGGWDEWNGNTFNIESGWGSPAIENGKVFQTMQLEEGTYTFEVSDLRNTNLNEEDQGYMVAALGNDLPNVENIDESLDYVRILSERDASLLKVTFTLTETSQVSMGIVTTQRAGSPGKFFSVREFGFYKHQD
ncbi:DUF4998 domain-containing protein [Echinicola salinicaeni]|uniref:DUF4998 domain-containing protein n=1 Tax=Echinicola salinicaeni TaxID=2762757 RepID=UPI001643FF63|nr:DUF4998 domain-containing protein [Echinicola salinicaeni]